MTVPAGRRWFGDPRRVPASLACIGLASAVALASPALAAATAPASLVLADAARTGDGPPPPPALLLPGLFDSSRGADARRPLRELVQPLPPAVEPVRPNLSLEDRRRALERYIDGRTALADGKNLIAVRALEEAQAIDPESPAVLEELARAYARVGNPTKACELFERLLRYAPDHPEALITLGMRAIELGDRSAIQRLGAVFLLPPERRRDGFGIFRPGAETAAELALARALRTAGADAAVVEVLSRTVERGDPDPDSRPMAEARRSLGDAYVRLADETDLATALGKAVAAWTGDGQHEPAEWERPLLEPRVAWALVASGRDRDAALRFREVMEPLLQSIEPGAIRDEDIALARWMHAAMADSSPLSAWGKELSSGHRLGATARLAAALDPASAVAILDRAAQAGPPDRRLVRDLLAAHAAESVASAARAATGLLRERPWEVDTIVESLLRSGLEAGALAAAGPYGDDPAAIALRARVLTALNDPGAAWKALVAADGSLPADPLERQALVDIAGRLDESSRLTAAADGIRADDAFGLLEVARAWRRIGEAERAALLAQEAAKVAREAKLERVESQAFVLAAQATGDRAARGASRQVAVEAFGLAKAAVAADRSNESAWRLLIGLLDALAAGDRDEQVRNQARQARHDAVAAIPASSLARQLELERLLAEGASVDAANALNAQVAADLGDASALQTLVQLLQRLGKIDMGLAILDERLAVTPADPAVWQLWTETTVAAGRPDEAIARLEAQAEREGGNPIVLPLRELALRAANRTAEADAIAAARIASLPASPRRDLERGAQAIARGEMEAGIAALDAGARAAKELAPRDALAGAELALRLKGDPAARSRLVRVFSESVLAGADRDPSTPGIFVARAAALLVLESDPGPEHDAERTLLVERAVATTKDGVGAADVPTWLAIGQVFADRERADEGSEFIAALLRSEHRIDAASAARLGMATFALDAAAGGRAERSIALLELLRSRGVRPFARNDRPEETEADALQLLANLYSIVGDRDGSTAILERTVEIDPRHPMALNNLGYELLERDGPTQRAAELIERAASVKPDDMAILDTLGWLRYRQGRLADGPEGPGAETLIRKAIAAAGDDPGIEPLDHLGDTLWRVGDKSGAMKAWLDAVRLADAKYPANQMVPTLANYERREYGLSVTDGEAWWKRSYGSIRDRVRAKLDQVNRKEVPSIAPSGPASAGR